MSILKYRDYQEDIINKGVELLSSHRFVYLSMEVRTGKTLTSLGILEKMNVSNVLFLTKKKAISSVSSDFDLMCPSPYSLFIMNYESMHKLPDIKWDAIVLDESHSLGAFPKPSSRAKSVKKMVDKHNPYVIMLSGTPTPESFSQMYHQVYSLPNNPFRSYKNFYRFSDDYVSVFSRPINGYQVKDYSNGMDSILHAMKPYMISMTQVNAGFSSEIDEEVLRVKMKDSTYALIKRLSRDLVVEGNEEVILADTGVKLMTKTHQMCSGTIKFESGNSMTIDDTKAKFIYDKFSSDKIGVFYKFKEELNTIKSVYGSDVCFDLDDFNTGNYKAIALQIVSGREGISLRNADFIVFYNIDFSATSYWQARDRMTTKERSYNKVYWIFSEGGIEDDIYKTVKSKKNFTLKHFRK